MKDIKNKEIHIFNQFVKSLPHTAKNLLFNKNKTTKTISQKHLEKQMKFFSQLHINKKLFIEEETKTNTTYHICYVGKFNPFHKGHQFVYQYLNKILTDYNLNGKVYICTTLKDDEFLTAHQKKQIIIKSGIPEDIIINQSGYNIKKLAHAVNANESVDVLIVVFSEKDLYDKSKLSLLQPPKDNVKSWFKLENIQDIKKLHPINFVPSEYQNDKIKKEKKLEKGHGYILVVPPLHVNDMIISSSKIKELIKNKKFNEVKELMATTHAYQYLKSIKQ